MTGETIVNMQLDATEVRDAVTEYLRKRGVTVGDDCEVRLNIIGRAGERINLVGASAVVVATNVKLPEGSPYR